jgi:hypothetical protein
MIIIMIITIIIINIIIHYHTLSSHPSHTLFQTLQATCEAKLLIDQGPVFTLELGEESKNQRQPNKKRGCGMHMDAYHLHQILAKFSKAGVVFKIHIYRTYPDINTQPKTISTISMISDGVSLPK